MQCLRDVMTTPVLTFDTFAPANDVWSSMTTGGVRHAVVLEGETIRGIVSGRDLGGRAGKGIRMGRAVGELMTEGAFTAAPSMSLLTAVRIMRERRIGCIPVVQRGKLIGIVTRTDILCALASDVSP